MQQWVGRIAAVRYRCKDPVTQRFLESCTALQLDFSERKQDSEYARRTQAATIYRDNSTNS